MQKLEFFRKTLEEVLILRTQFKQMGATVSLMAGGNWKDGGDGEELTFNDDNSTIVEWYNWANYFRVVGCCEEFVATPVTTGPSQGYIKIIVEFHDANNKGEKDA